MIGFTLVYDRTLDNREMAESVLEAICVAPDFMRPRKFGVYEPLENSLSERSGIEELIELWLGVPFGGNEGLLLLGAGRGQGFMIRWEKTPVAGPPAAITGNFEILRGTRSESRMKELLDLVERLVQMTLPVYGHVENQDFPESMQPFDFPTRLPDPPWLSIYGPPCVDHFGAARLRSAPAFSVQMRPFGYCYLQSTDSITENMSRDHRRRLKKHLGWDTFMHYPRWRYDDGVSPLA